MAKFYQSSEFRKLKAEWDQKLRDSGFEDAEEEKGGETFLKQRASHSLDVKKWSDAEALFDYFMLLSQHVSDEKGFDDESDKLIMRRTAEGWTIREISWELQERGKRKHNRDTIRYIRRRYEHKWGIRTWKPEQMVSRKPRMK